MMINLLQTSCLATIKWLIATQWYDIGARWMTHWLASRRMTVTPSTVTLVFMGRMLTCCSATFSLLFTRFPVIWPGEAAVSQQTSLWFLIELFWAMTHLAYKLNFCDLPNKQNPNGVRISPCKSVFSCNLKRTHSTVINHDPFDGRI